MNRRLKLQSEHLFHTPCPGVIQDRIGSCHIFPVRLEGAPAGARVGDGSGPQLAPGAGADPTVPATEAVPMFKLDHLDDVEWSLIGFALLVIVAGVLAFVALG